MFYSWIMFFFVQCRSLSGSLDLFLTLDQRRFYWRSTAFIQSRIWTLSFSPSSGAAASRRWRRRCACPPGWPWPWASRRRVRCGCRRAASAAGAAVGCRPRRAAAPRRTSACAAEPRGRRGPPSAAGRPGTAGRSTAPPAGCGGESTCRQDRVQTRSAGSDADWAAQTSWEVLQHLKVRGPNTARRNFLSGPQTANSINLSLQVFTKMHKESTCFPAWRFLTVFAGFCWFCLVFLVFAGFFWFLLVLSGFCRFFLFFVGFPHCLSFPWN